MSEKRTSAEPRIPNDEEATEDSEAFRQVDNSNRENFASFSDTTLQDIPTEILQRILVEAVAMEVKNMKLAKGVWKEKADMVISRLETVCSQWSSVLTTNIFRMELHRALDGLAQQKIRMEIVQESLVDHRFTHEIAALKDDIFLFCLNLDHYNTTSSLFYIEVYDRNNMAVMKDLIELTGLYDGDIAACNVSNCIYVLAMIESQNVSLLRITKDEDQKFNIQSWISDLGEKLSSFSVSDEGRVIVSSPLDEHHIVSIYNPNGLLHKEVILSRDVYGLELDIHSCVMRKSNGNLVVGSVIEQFVVITEIDTDGIIQRQ